MNHRVLVAMSGGVDSSVAAYLLKEQGYECIGATMRLFENADAGLPPQKTCCSLDDVADAEDVAYRLGMKFYVFNFTSDFREKVISRFISAYENGLTPNPCIDCNRYMKFEKLHQRARILDCDYIATGHYARIEEKNGRYLLKKAADPSKDQSYVLYSMTQEELRHTLFPLGEMKKEETREIAAERGFFNADKPDSQDICFVPDGDYAKVIRSHTGKEYPPGNFVDLAGRVIGLHKGIIHYTVGQRKGLGQGFGEKMYVCAVRKEDNTVVLGKDSDLFTKELEVQDFNWIAFDEPDVPFPAEVRIRYQQKERPATVLPLGGGRVRIVFDEAQRAVTPGQAAVVYQGDVVVGGGVICKNNVVDF